MAQKIPLTLYLFDVLYLNGESLITLPYVQRRQILAQNAGEIPLSKQIVTEKIEEAEGFLKEATAAGHEGLMAKKLDSPYTPGRRGKKWLKIKTVLETLDLVITAAEYGYWQTERLALRLLSWRQETHTQANFWTVGKTFKGLTDAEIIEMTKQLKLSAVEQEGHRVIVIPKIVVEVTYNEIQKSPRYKKPNGAAVCTNHPNKR